MTCDVVPFIVGLGNYELFEAARGFLRYSDQEDLMESALEGGNYNIIYDLTKYYEEYKEGEED
jgi:hypothetical protein